MLEFIVLYCSSGIRFKLVAAEDALHAVWLCGKLGKIPREVR